MTQSAFDRSSQNVGNILALEHVNITVPDQALATLFYVGGIGLTRDPYIDFGAFNVWINAGEQQFHLPTNKPQQIRGHVGVVVPDLDDLESRLMRLAKRLDGTRFGYKRLKRRIDVTCPWGNRIQCYNPGDFGTIELGIPYVELNVPDGSAAGIARFYTEIMRAPAKVIDRTCHVAIGKHQELRFHETRSPIPAYDGHHVAIYITDFSGPYDVLRTAGRISEESDAHQYRFRDIYDPRTGEVLYELEHEVRSLYHPMHMRRLINRNPAQSFFNYRQGRDAFAP
jgi:hypothetical protein